MLGCQAAKDAAVRHSRNSSSICLESGHRESFHGYVESGYLLNSLRKVANARRNRAWAGLRARLKFCRTPRRGGLRTRHEKPGARDWLPAKRSLNDDKAKCAREMGIAER